MNFHVELHYVQEHYNNVLYTERRVKLLYKIHIHLCFMSLFSFLKFKYLILTAQHDLHYRCKKQLSLTNWLISC